MAIVLPLFPRQTVVGGLGAQFLGEPFDVSEYAGIRAEAQVYGLIGTSPDVTVQIETANALHTEDSLWQVEHSFPVFSSPPELDGAAITADTVGRYMRARITLNGTANDLGATLSVSAMCRMK